MNNQFSEVGRLSRNAPFPSTRPFTLSGETIFRQPPIKLKKFKKPRRRAKGGKIIYDNPRARFYRNQELYRGVRPQRAARESGEGLRRTDTANPTNITINLADALDKRIDKDLELIEDIVEKEIRRRRGPAINRQPLRIGDRRPPQLSRRSRSATPPPRARTPEARIRGRGQEGGGVVESVSGESISIEEGSLEGPLLQETPRPTTPEGRARGGGGRYALRRVAPDDPDEPQEGSSEGSARDEPSQSYTAGGILVETTDTPTLEEQQQRTLEEQRQRADALHRDMDAYARRDRAASAALTASREPTPIGSEEDNFSAVSGNVHSSDENEREVRRQDDSSEQQRGPIRRGAAAVASLLPSGLSFRGRRREGGGQGIPAPEGGFSTISPISQEAGIVGGRGQLTPSDVPFRVVNPYDVDLATTEASSEITTQRLQEVLEGERDPSEESSIALD